MTGIICIDKEQGRTSFSVCAEIRRITGQKKCGHMGTLDPLATGVLPVMLGGATRFLDYYPGSDKGYRARFLLGKTTDTLDITGSITGEYPVNCSADDVAKALESFKGDITQIPPMYSAVSVGGKRLYELARQGENIERPSRQVTVRSIELISADENINEYEIDVLCSKGTYIRTLIDDLGKVLGCGAQKGKPEYYRGVAIESNLLPKMKVEIVVCKVPVKAVVDAAVKALYTGHIGDGKIFIFNVEDVVKVRTGETGYDAMQDVE